MNRTTLLMREDALVHEVLVCRDKLAMIASGETERGRRVSQYDAHAGKRPMKMKDIQAVAKLAVERLNEAINKFEATSPKPWDWDKFENKYDQ